MMAKIRHCKVRVTLNELSVHTKNVPEWEVGVLQAQWGDNAHIVDDNVIIEGALPDPRDEFERLAQLYGPKHSETPFVAAVYGNFGPGVNALRDAIARAAAPVPVFAEEAPVVADDDSGVDASPEEGGDSDDFYADLAGDVTEPAEAVA